MRGLMSPSFFRFRPQERLLACEDLPAVMDVIREAETSLYDAGELLEVRQDKM